MKPEIGISDKNLLHSSKLLSNLLADEMTLYIKTRKFHWNIAGESFMELHKLFEAQYKVLEESIDEIAERIGKLGHKTPGTMNEFLKASCIKEHPEKHDSSKEMIKELRKDYETIITHLRKDVEECISKSKDAGTADFLTGLMEKHETEVWILGRYLG